MAVTFLGEPVGAGVLAAPLCLHIHSPALLSSLQLVVLDIRLPHGKHVLGGGGSVKCVKEDCCFGVSTMVLVGLFWCRP